jgi:hypothetical protein
MLFHNLRNSLRSAPTVFAAALLGACAASGPSAPTVPDSLKPPAGQVLTLAAYATGVQIYECQVSKTDTARHEWVFKAPQATLADRAGNTIGKHYGGPTWEGNDGSKVVGAVKANDAGPDANAIPWLLLTSKANSGVGMFGGTQSIQRVGTVGGKAPAASCSQAEAGKEARVAYTATYYFYDIRP